MLHKSFLSIACLSTAGLLCADVQAQSNCSMPFQRNGSISMPVGYSGSTASIAVPTGYRLRVDMVSVSQRMASASSRATVEVASYAGGYYAAYTLPVQEGYYPQDRIATQQVSLYADSGSALYVRAYRGTETSTASWAQYSVSGCLVS